MVLVVYMKSAFQIFDGFKQFTNRVKQKERLSRGPNRGSEPEHFKLYVRKETAFSEIPKKTKKEFLMSQKFNEEVKVLIPDDGQE